MRFGILLCLTAGLVAATATGFDGRAVTGELTILAPDRVRIGTTEVHLNDLDRLTLIDTPVRVVMSGEIGVRLVDGSWLPVSAVRPGAGRERIVVSGILGELELPLLSLIGWGRPDLPPVGEGDAVQVASGVLRGQLRELRDGKLGFMSTLDAEPLQLNLDQVIGLRLSTPTKRSTGLRLRFSPQPGHDPLDLVFQGGALGLAAAPTVRVEPATLAGIDLRIEGGRRTYLSDLPVSAHEEGMFGVVWPRGVDRAIGGGPLMLGGLRYAKGLIVHSVATLTWDLAGAYLRLRARIGISDAVAPEGDCVVVLHGDGTELWRARVRGSEAPRLLDLDMSGVQSLILRIEAGERHDIGDHVAFADAQLIRAR